jgi:hypothetical protein
MNWDKDSDKSNNWAQLDEITKGINQHYLEKINRRRARGLAEVET